MEEAAFPLSISSFARCKGAGLWRSLKFIANGLVRGGYWHKRCYFLANYSDKGMALCGDTTIVLLGSCLPLGITYPCFTRDEKKRKAVKGLRIRIGASCGIAPADPFFEPEHGD